MRNPLKQDLIVPGERPGPISRVLVVLIGGLVLSLGSAWAVSICTMEFPGLRWRGRWLGVSEPLWGERGTTYFKGTPGNGRRWIGGWDSYWQPCRTVFSFRDTTFHQPGVAFPMAHLPPFESVSALSRWSRAHEPPTGNEPPGYLRFEVASGWPVISFHGGCVVDYSAHSARGGSRSVPVVRTPSVESIDWAVPIKISKANWGGRGSSDRSVTMLPLRPVFPGAIYSVGFWGAAVLGATLIRDRWRGQRMRRRLARGLCPVCTHELAGVSPCPECGTAATGWGEDAATAGR